MDEVAFLLKDVLHFATGRLLHTSILQYNRLEGSFDAAGPSHGLIASRNARRPG